MKSLIKVLAPVTLALAAVSAQAGTLEIDYGFPQPTAHSAGERNGLIDRACKHSRACQCVGALIRER